MQFYTLLNIAVFLFTFQSTFATDDAVSTDDNINDLLIPSTSLPETSPPPLSAVSGDHNAEDLLIPSSSLPHDSSPPLSAVPIDDNTEDLLTPIPPIPETPSSESSTDPPDDSVEHNEMHTEDVDFTVHPEKPLDIEPHDAPLEAQIDHPEEASSELSAAEKANIRVANQYITMCRAYLSRQVIEKALKELSKAINRAPSYIEPYFLRAEIYTEINELPASLDDFMTVIRLSGGRNSSAVEQAISLCTSLFYQQQYEVIETPLSALHSIQPSDAVLGQLYGSTLLALGQELQALSVLELYPMEISSHQEAVFFAELYEKVERYSDAERILLQAMEKSLINKVDLGT